MDSRETMIIATPAAAITTPSRHPSPSTTTSTLVDPHGTATNKCPADPSSTKAPSLPFAVDPEKQQYDVRIIHRPGPKAYTLIRYALLNTYRRLFSIVFIGNAIAFILLMMGDRQLLRLVNAAAANLLLCGLARQPLVVNGMYIVACRVPRSTPLRLRMLACKIFHFGGVHSGAGVASCLWYIAFVAVLTQQHVQKIISATPASTAVLVLAWIILSLLLAIIVAAYPTIRTRYHDYFEWTHRFSGWLVVLLFWALLLTFASKQKPSIGIFLIHQASFWIIMILTLAIIQPWAMLRRVPVRSEVLSSHAIRLHFDHTTYHQIWARFIDCSASIP